jgi:hypothetical protein
VKYDGVEVAPVIQTEFMIAEDVCQEPRGWPDLVLRGHGVFEAGQSSC